jgi:molybdate transport system permease protein
MTPAQWQTIILTLLVATTAVVASLPVAIGVGWLLAKQQFPGKYLVETVVNLPLVMPPVVTGYLLLVAFGRRGVLGPWLEAALGLRFVFDWKGAALASAVVGFPLMVRPIRQAFAAVDERLIHAARSLGAKPWDAFWHVTLPLALPGVLSGSVLAFARSMGEFGATIMIAGNIPGETRTISLYVYSQLDAPGGFVNAYPMILISIAIAALALFAGDVLDRYGQRRLLGTGA